jgi:beta-lactamase superfamily II metal-dependent hydrolase
MSRVLPTSFYVVILVVLVAANVYFYRALFTSDNLEIKVLDVGEKGSATLVRAPGGATILIDTGPDASILRALGTALPPWQRRIDLVILTSTKKSSVGGLPDVLSRYKVARQLAIDKSKRLVLASGAYVDISLTQDAPTGVSASDGGVAREIK